MAMQPEALYRTIGQLLSEVPAGLTDTAPLTEETMRWVGRVCAVVVESAAIAGGARATDRIAITSCADHLGGVIRHENAHQMLSILHRVFAQLEFQVPAGVRDTFIPVGAEFDVFQSVSRILGNAERDVLIVDPYVDPVAVTDFAALAPEGVNVRLLGDHFYVKREPLFAATQRWTNQYGATRPLAARLTPDRQLHDRLIVVDGSDVRLLSQSLKDFARRAPGSITRPDDDVARLKVWIANRSTNAVTNALKNGIIDRVNTVQLSSADLSC